MDVTRLLLATLLVFLCFFTAYSHLPPEEKLRDDRSLRSNSSVNLLDFPSVSIMGKSPSLRALAQQRGCRKSSMLPGVLPGPTAMDSSFLLVPRNNPGRIVSLDPFGLGKSCMLPI